MHPSSPNWVWRWR